MNGVKLDSGSYVVAVSGGVDSMTLLDILSKQKNVKLIVAHFEHGIRTDSNSDLELVRSTAKKYGLPFVYDHGNLGAGTSEATARDARYKFLNSVKNASNAKAIVTAHHQDDKLETAILNIMRGTGRKGLTSLSSSDTLVRPLLNIPKVKLVSYAVDNGLVWHEDSTNQNMELKRNYVRHKLSPRFSTHDRNKLIGIIDNAAELNRKIDFELASYIDANSVSNKLNRYAFIILPHRVALEVVAMWLRRTGVRDFNSKILERLTIAAKTLKAGQTVDINHTYFLRIEREYLAIETRIDHALN
jgi:tRNA(Ile)-lysidine synthase